MKRLHVHFTDVQRERLEAESVRTGLSVAELVRRYVDAGLSHVEDDRLRRDLERKRKGRGHE